jgi:hypothetical protein
MKAWPGVMPALVALRRGHEVFVLSNDTTRLQLNLVHSSGLEFWRYFMRGKDVLIQLVLICWKKSGLVARISVYLEI